MGAALAGPAGSNRGEVASRVESAPTLAPDCLILGAKQAFTREVADG
jgi:hypothetical protein